jgi:hypothetical protein
MVLLIKSSGNLSVIGCKGPDNLEFCSIYQEYKVLAINQLRRESAMKEISYEGNID